MTAFNEEDYGTASRGLGPNTYINCCTITRSMTVYAGGYTLLRVQSPDGGCRKFHMYITLRGLRLLSDLSVTINSMEPVRIDVIKVLTWLRTVEFTPSDKDLGRIWKGEITLEWTDISGVVSMEGDKNTILNVARKLTHVFDTLAGAALGETQRGDCFGISPASFRD